MLCEIRCCKEIKWRTIENDQHQKKKQVPLYGPGKKIKIKITLIPYDISLIASKQTLRNNLLKSDIERKSKLNNNASRTHVPRRILNCRRLCASQIPFDLLRNFRISFQTGPSIDRLIRAGALFSQWHTNHACQLSRVPLHFFRRTLPFLVRLKRNVSFNSFRMSQTIFSGLLLPITVLWDWDEERQVSRQFGINKFIIVIILILNYETSTTHVPDIGKKSDDVGRPGKWRLRNNPTAYVYDLL